MKASRLCVLVVAITLSSPAWSDCRDVIELSKTVNEVVQGSTELESMARAFCKEYASAKSSGSTMSVGGSYGPLSASFGKGDTSAEQIASKYCDSNNYSSARSDSFRQYVDSIAPGAFSAYERCLALTNAGVTITVTRSTVLPTYFDANVSFRSSDALAVQVIDFAASPGVECAWKNGIEPKGSKTRLVANSSDALQCKRPTATAKSAVQIFPQSKPDSALSFPWEAFEGNAPVDTLATLAKQIGDATASLDRARQSLSGSVVGFAAAQCPVGWQEYAPAAGRFLRGIDRNKTNDPDGQRAPGAVQADAFAAHDHARPRDVYDAGARTNGAVNPGDSLFYTYDGANPAPRTGMTGAAETRPKNVAVMFCIRP